MISIHRDCGIQQAANDKGGSRCSIQHIFSDSSLFVAIHDEIVQRLQNVYPYEQVRVHSPKNIQLVQREKILEKIVESWVIRQKALIDGYLDCKAFTNLVCVGIPGVGKTRLLEEWNLYFDKMGIPPENRMGLLVLYYNGHAITDADQQIPIMNSFAYRLLYSYFYDNSKMIPFTQFMTLMSLSPEYRHININDAILLILKAKGNIATSSDRLPQPFSIFLGIDEFQAIAGEESGSDKLEKLMITLIEVSQSLARQNIHLYTMLAGTEWTLLYATESGKDNCLKIPIPFNLNYEGIAAIIFPDMVRNLLFQSCLYELGSIPRNIVYFSQGALSGERFDLHALKDRVINAHAAQWKECPPGILFNLVAFSLSGLSVEPNLPSEPDQNSLTWRQLASRGLLELSERDQVFVPFVAILAILQLNIPSDLKQSVRPFMKSLREVKHLLNNMYASRWEQWERFGSHFHCVRMNALLALGHGSVSLATLFPGAQYSSFAQSSLFVTLRPAKVMKAQIPLSVDSNLESISGEQGSVNLKDPKHCFVMLNADKGKGVDVFFLLPRADGEGYVLILDERKRAASLTLSDKPIKSFSQRMSAVVPRNLENVTIVRCLFASLSSFGKEKYVIPQGVLIFGKEELRIYHTSLAYHPAARCRINVHLADQTLLASGLQEFMTKKIATECAAAIASVREGSMFLDFYSLQSELERRGHKRLPETTRVVFDFPLEGSELPSPLSPSGVA
jgi:hypothetical protein